ncbi:hypothetical protein [Nocardia miyunensis]|uniref:hypothetical protein n=1 Tax=Nocardia miyunensis TaxID=282684 RepID=UPI00082B1E80|nr:hypothetical protein [Nocardia miyunensis]
MSGDEVDIEPGRVGSSGTVIHTEAGTARTALNPLFDSAQPAADGNKGFATGTVLIKYATSLRDEIEDTITNLETAGERIVSAAQIMHGMDADNTTGFNRIVTALNGLSKPPQ